MTESASTRSLPTFTPAMLRRQLSRDSALRWLMLAGLLLAVFGAGVFPHVNAWWWNVLLIVLAVVWVRAGIASVRVSQQLQPLNQFIEHDPAAAESHLAALLDRKLLHRPVRLLLFHQFAALRHHQQRHAEAAAIGQTLLREVRSDRDLRLPTVIPAGQHLRTQVMLLLTESRLQAGDLNGAYAALMSLQGCELNLIESLQRMALQTQYEVAAGYDAHALVDLEAKVAYAELMPAPQCGAVHALLSLAAQRCNQPQLATWLRQRAELLCTPEQFERFNQSLEHEEAVKPEDLQ